MTEREQRALRVSAMLLEAETLAMESKRLGRKLVAAGILEEAELEHEDRRDYYLEMGSRAA